MNTKPFSIGCKASMVLCGLLLTQCDSVRMQGGSDIAFVSTFTIVDEDSVLVATSSGRLIRSDDAGANWRTMPNPGFEISEMFGGADGRLWAMRGLDGDGDYSSLELLMVSWDGGASWQTALQDADAENLIYVAELRGQDPVLFGGDGRVWELRVDGENQLVEAVASGNPVPDGYVTSGVFCEGTLWAASSQRTIPFTQTIWRSVDQGETWEEVMEIGAPVYDMACDGADNIWLTAWDDAVHCLSCDECIDRQVGFRDVGSGFFPSSLVLSGETLFVGGEFDREERSSVFGIGCDGAMSEISDDAFNYIAIDLKADDGGNVWLGGSGLFRLADSGDGWDQLWP